MEKQACETKYGMITDKTTNKHSTLSRALSIFRHPTQTNSASSKEEKEMNAYRIERPNVEYPIAQIQNHNINR